MLELKTGTWYIKKQILPSIADMLKVTKMFQDFLSDRTDDGLPLDVDVSDQNGFLIRGTYGAGCRVGAVLSACFLRWVCTLCTDPCASHHGRLGSR